ncbi:putative glutathione-specific gamma-glutamylcyclotransferase 2 [Ptychodera flava]|uniref:putative glutathione-specific gamma-glutamylcyclotransferase 2 n=1 Tax=Ptychodera flava TaxID=63121 RepID=UPI00396A80F0
MWVFGYGSLLWRPDFPFEEKVVGCVKGFSIRFWQESVLFRGTPEKPGRVAMLVEDNVESEVFGVAYKIKEDRAQDVLDQLFKRELFEPVPTMFYPKQETKQPFEVHIYNIVTSDSVRAVQYIGPERIEDTAKIISESIGPTGMRNDEYVFKLVEINLEIAGRVNPYLSDLENLIRDYQAARKETRTQ